MAVNLAYTSDMEGDFMPAIFTVIIHPNEGIPGYWAESPDLPGCFTDGDTIKETEKNMYESVSLFLEDDYPEIIDFSLNFKVQHA